MHFKLDGRRGSFRIGISKMRGDKMRTMLLAAVAAVSLALAGSSTAKAQYVQYYSPYGTPSYYHPNTGYMYAPQYTYGYTSNYVGPTVYGPGSTASYPYMYNQLNYPYAYPYSTYYSPGYTTYRTWRAWGY
jgi:hypothetical protein